MMRHLRRRPDRAALIDALTITVGIGLLAWVYAMQPALHDEVGSLTERVVRAAYPVGDLVLLCLTILLLRGNGRRGGTAPVWIAVAICGYLVGDWAWVVLGNLRNGWDELWWTGRTINGVHMLSLAVLGLAAWRPELHDDGPVAAAVSRLGRAHLAVLTVAVLIAPALLVTQVLDGEVTNGLAIAIGSATMFLLVVTRMAQPLKQAERHSLQVRELSRRDELTGLPNRRAWTDELPRVLEQARADGQPVSIAMLDLDRFKMFNDRHGHPAGDRLLKEAAAAWHGALRRTDILARYGGEEFIVLLPGADTSHAVAALERVRAVTPGGETFSAGVATWDGAETSEDLINRADTDLYAAKHAGRDRIISGSEPGPSVAQVQGPGVVRGGGTEIHRRQRHVETVVGDRVLGPGRLGPPDLGIGGTDPTPGAAQPVQLLAEPEGFQGPLRVQHHQAGLLDEVLGQGPRGPFIVGIPRHGAPPRSISCHQCENDVRTCRSFPPRGVKTPRCTGLAFIDVLVRPHGFGAQQVAREPARSHHAKMSAPVGLSLVESFVLAEADPGASLWEIATGWTQNGDDADRIRAVPLLQEAVAALADYGFVEVQVVAEGPASMDDSTVPAGEVKSAVDDLQSWLQPPTGDSVLTVNITEAGIPWL